MKKSLILSLVLTITSTNFVNAAEIQNNQKLLTAIEAVKNSCSGIKQNFDTIFGLSVATTVSSGVGTVASGAALGVGIAKANLDKKIEEKELQIYKFGGCGDASSLDSQNIDASVEQMKKMLTCVKDKEKIVKDLEAQIDKETKKSKQLGHARTGLMVGATATSAISTGTSVGAVVTADKLAKQIEQCNADLKALKIANGQLTAEGGKNGQAETILANCTGYDKANITTLKNLATANAVVSGVGTATALTGTITSAIANTDKIRNDNSDKGKKKEKNLNLVSNIFAGITAGTSATSTGLSAAQIAKAKKDSEMAAKCESVL